MASRKPIYTFQLTGYATDSNEKNLHIHKLINQILVRSLSSQYSQYCALGDTNMKFGT